MDIDAKREFYHNQPAVVKIKELKNAEGLSKKDRDSLIWIELDDFQMTKEEFVKDAENDSYVPFAVVKDGVFHEKGSMGWWGCVSDEKDQKQWNNQVNTLINDLPEDTMLSLYDCHI